MADSANLQVIASHSPSVALPTTDAVTAKRELRVLHVFGGLGMGGAETWLMSLLKYFYEQNQHADLKVRFDVLLTGGERAIFDDEAEALGARLFYLPFSRRTVTRFVREFRKTLAAGKYDAIHDHQDYIAGLHFLLGAGLLPPTCIAHVHNPLYHRRNPATGLIKRAANSIGKWLISHLGTHVMGTSRQIVTEYGFQDSPSANVVLDAAHCGFDLELYQGDRADAHLRLCRELGWRRAAKVILFVGRLEGAEIVHNGRRLTHKNPMLALEIARECISRDASIHLAVAGGGAEKKKEFEATVADWGLCDQICFLGVRSDIPQLMLGSDLLLFPSLAEGLGMVVVEAQAAGLRVLASDTTPRESVVIPELVSFSALTDSQEQWATKALRLLSLEAPDAARCNAKVRESGFSIENSATRLMAMYDRSVISDSH